MPPPSATVWMGSPFGLKLAVVPSHVSTCGSDHSQQLQSGATRTVARESADPPGLVNRSAGLVACLRARFSESGVSRLGTLTFSACGASALGSRRAEGRPSRSDEAKR